MSESDKAYGRPHGVDGHSQSVAPTLTDFLLARIAEDEEAAHAASPSPWSYPGIDSVSGGMIYDKTRTIGGVYYEQPEDHDGSIVRHMLATEADANGRHIARHDPDRVLAECEAKRQIVREYLAHVSHYESRESDGWPADAVRRDARVAGRAVELLASIYADHPDYNPDWRP